MADEDEIDILGDFSFNSCFALNNQGIPSCSNREDTVHPQWLLDSTANNWYDTQNIDINRTKDGPSRKLSGNNTNKYNTDLHTSWSQTERNLLRREMAKYGRNVPKISQSLTTKTEAEIQALIEAEYGILLETPTCGLERQGEQEDTPSVVQEEIVTDDLVSVQDVLTMVTTGTPTIPVPKRSFNRNNHKVVNNSQKTKPVKKSILNSSKKCSQEDITVSSTESVMLNLDMSKSIPKHHKERVKAMKNGNHRRKMSRNYDRGKNRNSSKDNLKSPQGRPRKDSSLSDENLKSPKMQIILGSGQALPLSEGEQVIKIEKKKDSECESDIEIDVDSDLESSPTKIDIKERDVEEAPVAVPLRKFEPMPKRNRKLPLSGGGGYTIMHTEKGDMYEISREPRKERPPKREPIQLIQCRLYNSEKPAPCEVHLHVSALIGMDVHAHGSRAEVMGLLGGSWAAPRLLLRLYRRARAAAAATHCDMDPVSQAGAAEWLAARGAALCGWHHSHPRFPAAPSAQDLRTQRALQRALAWPLPFLALITSQHWAARAVPSVSRLRCFRVEESEPAEPPAGYQLRVRLVPDLTSANLAEFLRELRAALAEDERDEFSVDMAEELCPQAGITYLEKCILSVRHHLQRSGYDDQDPLVARLVTGLRDVFS